MPRIEWSRASPSVSGSPKSKSTIRIWSQNGRHQFSHARVVIYDQERPVATPMQRVIPRGRTAEGRIVQAGGARSLGVHRRSPSLADRRERPPAAACTSWANRSCSGRRRSPALSSCYVACFLPLPSVGEGGVRRSSPRDAVVRGSLMHSQCHPRRRPAHPARSSKETNELVPALTVESSEVLTPVDTSCHPRSFTLTNLVRASPSAARGA
jgi:hypothetical protein